MHRVGSPRRRSRRSRRRCHPRRPSPCDPSMAAAARLAAPRVPVHVYDPPWGLRRAGKENDADVEGGRVSHGFARRFDRVKKKTKKNIKYARHIDTDGRARLRRERQTLETGVRRIHRRTYTAVHPSERSRRTAVWRERHHPRVARGDPSRSSSSRQHAHLVVRTVPEQVVVVHIASSSVVVSRSVGRGVGQTPRSARVPTERRRKERGDETEEGRVTPRRSRAATRALARNGRPDGRGLRTVNVRILGHSLYWTWRVHPIRMSTREIS